MLKFNEKRIGIIGLKNGLDVLLKSLLKEKVKRPIYCTPLSSTSRLRVSETLGLTAYNREIIFRQKIHETCANSDILILGINSLQLWHISDILKLYMPSNIPIIVTDNNKSVSRILWRWNNIYLFKNGKFVKL